MASCKAHVLFTKIKLWDIFKFSVTFLAHYLAISMPKVKSEKRSKASSDVASAGALL